MRGTRLKDRNRAGEATFGIVASLGSSAAAEMIGFAGYDFVVIDGEHGPGDWNLYLNLVRAVQATEAAAVIRVPAADPIWFKRALDIGADGVMVPNVDTAEQAAFAVRNCRYPPEGNRGSAVPLIRASRYGLHSSEYVATVSANLFIAVQIETRRGVDNAREIAAVEGIDSLVVGPLDLAGDLGITDLTDARFVEAIQNLEQAAAETGFSLGAPPFPGRPIEALQAHGYRMITNGTDVGFLRDALTRDLSTARKLWKHD